MTTSEDADTIEAAVDLLERFEFTEYEARSFVALCRIGQGSARDVDEVSQVPRARVYGCMEALAERGVVDVQEGSPRTFRAVDHDEAIATIERRTTRQLDQLHARLAALSAPERGSESGDVWVLEGVAPVADRLEGLIGAAEAEVLLALADPSLLTDDLRAAITDADAREVEMLAASPSEEIRAALRRAAPHATVLETWTWWEEVPIQQGAISAIALLDGSALLASTRLHAAGASDDHRAVWTDGGAVPIVGMMRPLLESGLRRSEG
ncbi:TrmB family transcriptional regulator [Halococcoides cellulosivorans]|uniref:TrmB family transcriptional regulator n=1 Tax=Halococcoides cellulosivorans TaxID=1679096 RepID=UPI001F465224|nr:helix-turn-helix domain-containing protein [Halococcoides cellulosivorans]